VSAPRFRFGRGVTLIGGGAPERAAFDLAVTRAPHVVAADGGANALRDWGIDPEAIIGDMDSVRELEDWRARPGVSVAHVAEQDSTDLEKCLAATEAPFFLGVGLMGRRFDHSLAALHALLRWPERRVVLLSEEDAVFMAPEHWQADLAPGARVSFFPLLPVRGLGSSGLRWPIEGLDFAPGQRIGTSNAASAARVSARFAGPGMVAMVEPRFLDAVLDSLTRA